MRAKTSGRRGCVVVAVVVATILLFSCAPGPAETQKKGNVLEIGLIADLTGGASAAVYQPFMVLDNYVRYFNEEEGIPGVKVQLSWVDSARSTAKTVSAYRAFVAQGVPIIVTICAETQTLKPMCARDEVPLLTFSISEGTVYPPGWVYTVFPTDAEKFAVVCDWIVANWKGERAPRVCFMGPDSFLGREPEAQGSKYAESVGIEMLPMEIVDYVPIDVTPQLLRLKDREADYVYLSSLWTTALPILKDAERLGLLDQIHFSGYENTQCTSMIEVVGPAAEGYFAPRVVPWGGEEDIPGVKLMRDLMTAYQGKVQVEGDEGNPMRAASVICEAFRRAVDELGCENVDGVGVRAALDSIEDFDPYGLGPITYLPDDHTGSKRVRIYQVSGGKVVPVSEWQDAPTLRP